MPVGDAGSSQPDTVMGHVSVTCHERSTDVELPTDLSSVAISALIPDLGPTGYRKLAGDGGTDGLFTIAGVPPGASYLLVLDQTYYATDQRVLDLHTERIDRCAPPPATTSDATLLTFELSNLTPFSTGVSQSDRLEIDSFALGYHAAVRTSDLVHGGTTATTIGTVDWMQFPGTELPDSAAGDDLHILHTRADTERDPATGRARTITHLIDQLDAPGVRLLAGVPATLTGSLQPVVANRTASFSLDRATFDAVFDGRTSPAAMSVRVMAQPVAKATAAAGGAVVVSFALGDTSRTTSLVQTVTGYGYADPFPDAWPRVLAVDYERFGFVPFPAQRFEFDFAIGNHQLLPWSGEVAPAAPLPGATTSRSRAANSPLVASWSSTARPRST